MCLIIEKGRTIAKRDKQVYKVVFASKKWMHWIGAFRKNNKKFSFGKVVEEHGGKPVCQFYDEYIEGGFFHSCTTKERCREVYDFLVDRINSDILSKYVPEGYVLRMVKCTIPAGSVFYSGINKDVASNKLIVHDSDIFENDSQQS